MIEDKEQEKMISPILCDEDIIKSVPNYELHTVHHIQVVKGIIAKDLNTFRSRIEINQIVKIHNSLTID